MRALLAKMALALVSVPLTPVNAPTPKVDIKYNEVSVYMMTLPAIKKSRSMVY